MCECNVSLRKLSKRFQISQEDNKEPIYERIKNTWMVQRYFFGNFSVDPLIFNGDEMSHRRLSILKEAYVKEKYYHFRERITVFFQVSSDSNVVVKPELAF